MTLILRGWWQLWYMYQWCPPEMNLRPWPRWPFLHILSEHICQALCPTILSQHYMTVDHTDSSSRPSSSLPVLLLKLHSSYQWRWGRSLQHENQRPQVKVDKHMWQDFFGRRPMYSQWENAWKLSSACFVKFACLHTSDKWSRRFASILAKTLLIFFSSTHTYVSDISEAEKGREAG